MRIDIYQDIGENYGFFSDSFSATDALRAVKAAKEDEALDIHINSAGGDVFSGLAIYNTFKAHKGKKTVYVDGIAASISSVIAMSGDEIVVPDSAFLMVHKPWSLCAGNADKFRQNADTLDKIEDAILSAYCNRTGKPREEISALLSAETYLRGSEALALGFATSLGETTVDPIQNKCITSFYNKLSNMPKEFRALLEPAEPKDRTLPGHVAAKNNLDVGGMEMPNKDTTPNENLEALQQELVSMKARLALAEVRASLGDKDRGFFDALDEGKKQAFLAASVEERNKMLCANETLEVNGVIYNKNVVGESMFNALKGFKEQNDRVEKELAAQKEATKFAAYRATVEKEYVGVPGTVEEKVKMLNALDSMGEDSKIIYDVLKKYKALSEHLLDEHGHSVNDSADNTAYDIASKKAKDLMKEDTALTFSAALDKVFALDPELYTRYREEM